MGLKPTSHVIVSCANTCFEFSDSQLTVAAETSNRLNSLVFYNHRKTTFVLEDIETCLLIVLNRAFLFYKERHGIFNIFEHFSKSIPKCFQNAEPFL